MQDNKALGRQTHLLMGFFALLAGAVLFNVNSYHADKIGNWIYWVVGLTFLGVAVYLLVKILRNTNHGGA